MKRYYSHYIFIYPDIYLKNHVIELDTNNRIVDLFPFEKEIENTSFYSGLLYIIPVKYTLGKDLLLSIRHTIEKGFIEDNSKKKLEIPSKDIFSIYDEDGILL